MGMITQEVWMDIKGLHRQGASIREIARRSGLSRKTIRRVLSERVPKGYGPRPPKERKLDRFIPWLEGVLKARPWVRATVLYRELVGQGYDGHYERVKVWAREARRVERARRQACVRFETGPGVEGQFDWKGPIRGLLLGSSRELFVCRFQLAYSRRRWSIAVPNVRLATVLWSLCRSFAEAGGVPQRLVIDNAKVLVLRPRPVLKLNPSFSDLCAHYSVEPAPAWVYSPQRKGKTERTFLDLVGEELLHQVYPDLASFQVALDADDRAYAARRHTTTGQPPEERFERERSFLLPLPAASFDPRLPETRRVLTDCTISYLGAYYSVPYVWVGRRVTVKADPLGTELEIFSGAECVARHRLVPKGQRSLIEEHVADLRRPRLERARQDQAPPPSRSRTSELLSVVPWPATDAGQRPIEEYALALEAGGAR
jgi:transposase